MKLITYIKVLAVAIVVVVAGSFWLSVNAKAQTAPSDFALLITPSPIVTTVQPGKTTTVQLKIMNNGSKPENLQIQPRSFVVNNKTGAVTLGSTPPAEVNSWISFSSPKFTVAPGQIFTENVILTVPKEAGFSYSFALLINRQANPSPSNSGRIINGSVADFVLMNVDRPGAVRQLSVPSFTVSKHVYEWLPANFTVQFKNTGNSIVAPAGNIFIQRSANSKTPIDVLPVNPAGGYILPNTERPIKTSWANGFPAYKQVTNSDGSSSQHLTWSWSSLSSFRFGKYTAKLVAVYNNGHQDVPIEAQVSFWVIPWKIMLVLLVLVLVVLFGLLVSFRSVVRFIRRKQSKPVKFKR